MNTLYNLKEKTAWITGGKRIGQKVAEVLAQHGANLILSYRNSKEESEITLKKVKNFGVKAMAIQADVSSRKSTIDAVKTIQKKFKQIDVLVLMASVFEPVELMSIKEEDLKKNFEAHVLGTFFPIQASLNLMPRGSHIITVADRTSIGKIYSGYLPYVVTKGCVAYLTKSLAVELAPKGIFINSIAPGPVLKSDDAGNKSWDKLRKSSAINYKITDEETVEEFAKLVLYLSTARSTGSIYPLDFGHL